MSEAFGAVTFPMTAPVNGVTTGDPALGYIGAFLRATINAAVIAAWKVAGISPKRDAVSFIFLNDPQKGFEENRLPALYLWRSQERSNPVSDDRQSTTTQISCYWIMEDAQDDHDYVRTPMGNAVFKSAMRGLFIGRDPAWKVIGDADPRTPVFGSFLWGYCGAQNIRALEQKPLTLRLDKIDGDGKVIPYYGLAIMLEMVELSASRTTEFYEDNAVDGTLVTNGTATITDHEIVFDETLESGTVTYGTPAS